MILHMNYVKQLSEHLPKHLIFLIICLFVCICQSGYAQEVPKLIPPSPTASAIQQYGNTDIGLYTGSCNRQITMS